VSFDALRQSIESRMADNWSETPVAYGNVPYNPTNASWVRLTVTTGLGDTLGMQGSTIYVRDTGVVSLQVFTKEGQGTKAGMALVDTFLPIFEHARFGGILTYTGSVSVVGVQQGWHQINVTIPFRRVRNV
jgi:hypothetical protein